MTRKGSPKPLNSLSTKAEIKKHIAAEWTERRAKVLKRKKEQNAACLRWRLCENYMDQLEEKLGRTLSVREYQEVKTSFGINL